MRKENEKMGIVECGAKLITVMAVSYTVSYVIGFTVCTAAFKGIDFVKSKLDEVKSEK